VRKRHPKTKRERMRGEGNKSWKNFLMKGNVREPLAREAHTLKRPKEN